jgi:hypothetical protein
MAPLPHFSATLPFLYWDPVPVVLSIGPGLDIQIHPKFHYKKEDSSSHQNIGTYMEY